jgi:four helix bundle protein
VTEQEFKDRTRKLGLDVIRLVERLPRNRVADVIGRQLLRCALSVGANYRAACRARSHADMIAKLAIVEEEADETTYWLGVLVDADVATKSDVREIQAQADSLLAMTVASIKTLRRSRS